MTSETTDIHPASSDGEAIAKPKPPVTAARVKAITSAIISAAHRDAKLTTNADGYVTWFIGIASAGLAICVTQSKPITDANLFFDLLPLGASKTLIAVSAILFSVSVVFGVILRSIISKSLQDTYKKISHWEFQLFEFESGETHLPDMGSFDLYSGLSKGRFLAPRQRSDFEKISAAIDENPAQVSAGYKQFFSLWAAMSLLAVIAAF